MSSSYLRVCFFNASLYTIKIVRMTRPVDSEKRDETNHERTINAKKAVRFTHFSKRKLLFFSSAAASAVAPESPMRLLARLHQHKTDGEGASMS